MFSLTLLTFAPLPMPYHVTVRGYHRILLSAVVIGLKADGKKAGVLNMLCSTSTTTFDFVFFDDSAAVAWRTGLGSCGSGNQQASSKDFQVTIVGPAVDLTCHCG